MERTSEVIRKEIIAEARKACCLRKVMEVIDGPNGNAKARVIVTMKVIKNLEKKRESSAKWRAENPEEAKERSTKQYQENSDKIKERSANQYQENSDKIKERLAKWYQENLVKIKTFYNGASAISNTWEKVQIHHVIPYLRSKNVTKGKFDPTEANKCIPLEEGQHMQLHLALSMAIFEATDKMCMRCKDCDPWPTDFDYIGWTRNYILEERAKIDNPCTLPLDFYTALHG